MTEQQTLVSLARSVDRLSQSVERLSRALDEAHNLATSAIEDRDEIREVAHTLCSERDEASTERDRLAARVETLAAELESWGGSMTSALAKALRAALHGEVQA